MKKLFMILVALVATTTIMAQMPDAMQFAGKGNMSMTALNVSVDQTSDTVSVSDKNTAFTLPEMSYNMLGSKMSIPSIKIGNLAYTMSGSYRTGDLAFNWSKKDTVFTVNVNGTDKKVSIESFDATFTHATNKLDVKVLLKYGTMPFTLTYTQTGWYVKSCTDSVSVTTAGQTYVNKSVTYKVRKYTEDEKEMVDVEIPTFQLLNTVMGDLTLGGYTVKGIEYSDDVDAYYRDYSADGLQMHFFSTYGFNTDYPLSAAGGENIKVSYNGTKVSIVNNFKPGSMPFPITSQFPAPEQQIVASVHSVSDNSNDSPAYNLNGQRVNANSKGFVIIRGRKYYNK